MPPAGWAAGVGEEAPAWSRGRDSRSWTGRAGALTAGTPLYVQRVAGDWLLLVFVSQTAISDVAATVTDTPGSSSQARARAPASTQELLLQAPPPSGTGCSCRVHASPRRTGSRLPRPGRRRCVCERRHGRAVGARCSLYVARHACGLHAWVGASLLPCTSCLCCE